MTQDSPDCDTTIADLHDVRRQIADRFDGDIAAIVEDARKRQEASGRAVWQGSTSRDATGAGLER
jgi:hypothetical protein